MPKMRVQHDEARAELPVPKVINDYNHSMNSVEFADLLRKVRDMKYNGRLGEAGGLCFISFLSRLYQRISQQVVLHLQGEPST